MANKLDVMDIKQIPKLKESGASNRKIAEILGISGMVTPKYPLKSVSIS